MALGSSLGDRPLNGQAGALFVEIYRTACPPPVQLIGAAVERLFGRGSVGGFERLGRFPFLYDHGEYAVDHLLLLRVVFYKDPFYPQIAQIYADF